MTARPGGNRPHSHGTNRIGRMDDEVRDYTSPARIAD
jgi:hypothetical protein